MRIFYILLAFVAILCKHCWAKVPTQLTLRKCCPEDEILDNRHECVENIVGDAYTKLDDKVLKKFVDTNKKKAVTDDIVIVANVTGNHCEIGNDYIAKVSAIFKDESLDLELMNKREITRDYSCIDHMNNQDDVIAIVCHDTIATKTGFVNKCCPYGQAVDIITRKCEDIADDEKDNFLSNLSVRSRWTDLPTKVFDVKIAEFDRLCESGHTVSALVEGITSDGFMFNDTLERESEYGCVDMFHGDTIAWTCTGRSIN